MSHIPTIPPTETQFLAFMFDQDAKNYHVWSYRQWLVRHFSLWGSELPYVEHLLQSDVRNNSAWNHRWFIVFARHTDPQKHSVKNDDADSEVPLETIEREIEYTKAAISTAPQNQSPWNYLRGVLRKKGVGLVELKGFAEQYADLEREDDVRSRRKEVQRRWSCLPGGMIQSGRTTGITEGACWGWSRLVRDDDDGIGITYGVSVMVKYCKDTQEWIVTMCCTRFYNLPFDPIIFRPLCESTSI